VPEKSDPLTVVPTGARVRELFSGFGHRQVEGCAEEVALSSDLPDSELIAGSRTEPAMFSEIFDRHHSDLYRYLRRRVGVQLAGDLAAETFVTVPRSTALPPSFRA
jgi:hypothetical protein